MLLVGILLLAGAGRCHRGLSQLKKKYKLVPVADPLENAPPELAFTTVALGAFNGLIADFLWMRAMRLQEDAKYFEAVQLADWITKLQPRFTLVWLFQAWNMSYNISVEFPDFHDRWLWVQRGAELLRDDGMRYNPSDPDMYRELAWIFFDKMGGQLDDANMYYKREWVRLMTTLFDGPKPDYDSLINAPKTEEQLRKDPAAARFLDALAAAGCNLAEDFFKVKNKQIDVSPEAKKLLKDPANKTAYAKVSLYARAKELREHYRLDPAEMRELDKRFGGLEWRLPEAHGLYWAVRGVEVAPKGDTSIHTLNNDRVMLHALESNFERGQILTIASNGIPLTKPNPNVIPPLKEYWEMLEQRYPGDKIPLESGYLSFLRSAVRILYLFNRKQQAAEYYRMLQKRRPDFLDRPTVEEFVASEFRQELVEGTGQKDTYNLVLGMLFRALWYLAAGDETQAASYQKVAEYVHSSYMKKWVNKPGRWLPPLQSMKKKTVDTFLSDKDIPEVLRNRVKARLDVLRSSGAEATS